MADVEDLMVGRGSHGLLGVGLLRYMDPQGGAALAGGAEVELDGVGVVSEHQRRVGSSSSRIATRKPWG
jgi:hypothetical protein